MLNPRKIAIIGCGFVGAASAFSIMQSGLFSEMVLIDVDKRRAEGEAMDISHGMPFARPMNIYAGDYEDISDAYVIVVTAGANQKPGETRIDLVQKNIGIFKSIIPEIARYNKEGILLVVSNPVDILTYAALKLSGFPENRVIGSGTVLDTARFKYLLGNHFKVDSRTVHAFIVGEHGDSELPVWSSAHVSNIPINEFAANQGVADFNADKQGIFESVRDSAYQIIERKKATYYGVAMVVRRICECIVRNERSILSVSSIVHSKYGIDDICLSLPSIVSGNGLDSIVNIPLDETECALLKKSADKLKATAEQFL